MSSLPKSHYTLQEYFAMDDASSLYEKVEFPPLAGIAGRFSE